MASLSTPKYFYQPPLADKSNERKESFSSSVSNKSIENPLLSRDPPPLQTETAPPGHGAPTFNFGPAPSANDSTAATSILETDGGMGLRHRRRQTGIRPAGADNKENRALALLGGSGGGVRHPSPSMVPGLPPPPTASYSLGTGMDQISTNLDQHYQSSRVSTPLASKSLSRATPGTPSVIDNSLVPSTSNCWVLVFGYTTTEQYDELLQRFSSYGQVLDHRGICQPGQSNWIAIQYASELEAKKALCHTMVKLSSNIYCCVQPLSDDDPILLHKYTSTLGPDSSWRIETTTKDLNDTSSSATPGGLTESDILVKGRIPAHRNENICTRMLRWMLGIPADEEEE